jgi:hypothetical protein
MTDSHHHDMNIPLVISTNHEVQERGNREDVPSWNEVEEHHYWYEDAHNHPATRTVVPTEDHHFASMDPENPYCTFLMSRVLPCFWLFQWWIMEEQQAEDEVGSLDRDDDEYHEDDDASRFRLWYHRGFSLLQHRPFSIFASGLLILLVFGYMALWTRYRHPGSNRLATYLQKKSRMQIGGGMVGLSNTAILILARHIPTCFLGISNILLMIFHQKVAALVVLVFSMLFMGVVSLGWGHPLDSHHHHTTPIVSAAFHFHQETTQRGGDVSLSPTPGECRNWALLPTESHDDDILL